MKVSYCDNCKRMVGISCACHISIVEKIKGLQLHPNATPSKTRRKYWDQESLNECFGEDATERSLEMTEGQGFNRPASMQGMFDD